MSLATVLTADPVEALAQDLADDCARLAQKSVAVYTGTKHFVDARAQTYTRGDWMRARRRSAGRFFRDLRDAS